MCESASASSARGEGAASPIPLALLIAVTAAIRVLFALGLGLGIDESYMVAAGRVPQLSYFDHPPLAWWLAAAAEALSGGESDVAVRLPFIALFALSTWLMFVLAAGLFGRRAGLWAALAFNLSPVFAVTTAGWVLPDGPLVAALLAGAVCLVRALESRPSAWLWWGGAGLAAGLALLSKYSAVLVLAGAVAAIASQPRHRAWLARPHPYAAAALALLVVSPVLVWNAQHHWVSFLFQGDRAAAVRLNPAGPLATLAGEALFLLPWIWLGLMAGLWRALRTGPRDWPGWLLAGLAIVPVVLFCVVSLWSRHVLFHWAAPGYLFAFPLLGRLIDQASPDRRRMARTLALASAALVCAGLAAASAERRWNWVARIVPGADPALQAQDWTALRADLAARGLLARPNTVIAATSWADTGKLDHGLGGAPRAFCLNADCRQYAMLPNPVPRMGRDVLIVAPRGTLAAITAAYGALFDDIAALPPATLSLPGRAPVLVPLFEGHGLHGWPVTPK